MERMKRYVAVAVLECFFASTISMFMIAETPAAPPMPVSAQSLAAAGAPAAGGVSGAGAAGAPAAGGAPAGQAPSAAASSAEMPVMRETSQEVTPEGGGKLELEGVVLEIPPGAVEKPVLITLRSLPVSAALGEGMANVTSGAQAYRFEPHGTQFLRPVYVSLPFEREMLGSETALSNLYTYFYDEWAGRWERLTRLSLDREKALVRSETTHFTDMVNATLKLPEGPSPISFDVNSIKNLEAADPSTGVPGLEGLEGGQQGSASFQIALRLPAGRGGATPQLALAYSSENPNSWLGRGFDISVPAVSIDTKFGLPRYDGTDTYVLAAEKLVEVETVADGTRYRPLTEKAFQKILRRQSGSEIYWEVTDKSGAVSEYGRGEGWIGPSRADHTRVYTWYLTKTRDAFGNTVEYDYSYDEDNAFTYLSEIKYSGFEGSGAPEEGAYQVVFLRQEADRPDRRIDSRGAFLSKLAKLLGKVEVRYRNELVRSYVPVYTTNLFGQSQLESWTETDKDGNSFYTYAFDYYGLVTKADGYQGFAEEVDWTLPPAGASRVLSSGTTASIGVNLYTGMEFFIWIPFVGTISLASIGITGGYNYSSTMSMGSLIDINGDGLPDMVWKNGEELQSYLNGNGSFVDTFNVSGLTASLDKESQHTVSVGGSVGLAGLSAGVSYQHSWSDSSTGFADVNGDGFVDFLTAGERQFGMNNGESLSGQMKFDQTNWIMPETPPSGVPPVKTEDSDNYKRVYYQQEPARKWRAYRSGTVEVFQDAWLIDKDSASLDGVRLYTYSDGGSDAIALSRGASLGGSTRTYSVDRDDPLYFRMETGESERGDDAYWKVRIGYTSVKFFEGMNVAEFSPPASSSGGLPFGDARLGPIYTVTSLSPLTYGLRADWQELPYADLQPVYEALAEHACFIPLAISKADMDLIVQECKNEPDQIKMADADGDGTDEENTVPAENVLLTGYRYVNETQTLYRVNAEGDALMASQLPQAFPYPAGKEDLKRIASYEWIDDSRVYPRRNGGEYSVERSAPESTVPARILDDAANAVPGETVWQDGILLDNLWSSSAFPAILESTWLREDGVGGWRLYARDEGGDREVTGADLNVEAVGIDGLSVSFMDLGVRRSFALTGKTSEIEEIGREAYEGPVSQAVLDGETFSTYGCEIVSAAALDVIIADVAADDPDDGEFIQDCYELDGAEYALISTISDEDLHRLIGLLDPYVEQAASVYDVFDGDSVRRFIRLSDDDYDDFIAGQPAQIVGCFHQFADGAATYHHLVRNLTMEQRTALNAVMRAYRRDAELFPYYTLDAGTGVRSLADPTPPQEVLDIMEEAGLFVYAGITRSIVYIDQGVFPVTTPETPPDDADEELDAPRGEKIPADGAQVGVVDIMAFDAENRTVFDPRYLHVFASDDDFSTQNLVRTVDPDPPAPEPPELPPEPDPYLACSGENESFHGGVYGWYYGAWTGYYTWDAAKIGTQPPQPPQPEPDPDPELDPNLEPGEAVSPPYFEAMDSNIDPEDGSQTVVEEGKGGRELLDAWVGKVSQSSEPSMDDETGQTISENYTYAAYIDGATLHPSRNGGDAYFQIPANAGSGDPGSLRFIRTSESSAVDINGGFSIGVVGGNISWNTGSSWQDLGMLDMNGDRYPDLVDFSSYSGGKFNLYPGTGFLISEGGAGFGEKEDWSTPFSDISSFKTSVVGFGASVSASAGGIKVERDDKGKPRFATIKEPGGGGSLGANGTLGSSYQTVGFFDMNGDSLPDHVQRDGTGNFLIALNLGDRTFSSVPLNWGSGITTPGNLLDVVEALTSQPAGLTHTSTGSFGATVGLTLDAAVLGAGISAGFTGTVNQTYGNLADVNGDGLPDQVVKLDGEAFFRVKFNLGDRFSDAETRLYREDWRSFNPEDLRAAITTDLVSIAENLSGVSIPEGLTPPGFEGLPGDTENGFSSAMNPFRIDDVLGYNSGISFSLGVNLTVRITFPLLALTIKAGVDGSWASTSATLSFEDVDGDGLPDHVMKLPYENFVRVKPNTLGRVGLLRAVTLPQGGSYELEYARAGNSVEMPQNQWVLSAVTKNDGVESLDLNDDRGEHSYRVDYEYLSGYYDREKREFCGFGRVDSRFADGSVLSVWYHAGLNQYYRRGMEYKREISGPVDGGAIKLLRRMSTEIQPQSEGYYDGIEVLFPKVESETQELFDASSSVETCTTTRTDYSYDRDLGEGSYGNIGLVKDMGDIDVDGDELYTRITYADLPGYFKQHPDSIRVEGAGGVLLRLRKADYGSLGQLTGLKQYESEEVGRDWFVTWNRFGNMESVEDPRGYTVSWEYDEDVRSFVTKSTISNLKIPGTYQYSSSAAWNPRFGVETSRTDMNGQTMSLGYDPFGRLTEVRSPHDTAVSLPAVSYRYQTSSAPWYVETLNKVSFTPGDNQTLSVVLYIDGLGRAIQTAKQGELWENGARRAGWNLSGAVAFDGKGRAEKEGQPQFVEGPAVPAVLAAMSGETEKVYDPLDRLVKTILPDPEPDPDPAEKDTIVKSYFIRDGRQVERTEDPRGSVSEKILDGRRNTVAVRRLEKIGEEENYLTGAQYSYNGLGEILQVTDQAGNITRSGYDTLGRRISLQSPDAGTVEYDYDESGNVARKTDSVMRSRGQSIQYFYDGLNRLVRIDYPKTADALYQYGSPGAAYFGAGRLIRRDDASGSVTYRYGELGETVETTRTINRLTAGASDETATFRYVFDYLGRMQEITYPDGEEVTYAYDGGGQVMSVSSDHNGQPTVYVEEVGYDESGRQVYIKYGNGIETRFGYDPGRDWLESITTETEGGMPYQTMAYAFDELGNVRRATSSGTTVTGDGNIEEGFEVTADYAYDALYRLISAGATLETEKYGQPNYTSSYSQEFGFNAIGTLTFKTSSLSTVPRQTIGAALDYELDYAYYAGKAHQAERVGNMWYRFDANGNMTEEREGGHSTLPTTDAELSLVGDVRVVNRGFGLPTGEPPGSGIYQRNFTWNEENRLTRSADANVTVDYRYGADGERAVKYTSGGETLYFDSMWQMATDFPTLRQSKHIYVGSSRIATRCNFKGSVDFGYEEENTFYYHPDRLGSAELVTDYLGKKYEHMEYTPYGELWVEEISEAISKTPFRFTGKEMDEETGLYTYGARYLNPRTSMWISADPAMEKYLPVAPVDEEARKNNDNLPGLGGVFNTVNLAAYAYAGNNPVVLKDPDGKTLTLQMRDNDDEATFLNLLRALTSDTLTVTRGVSPGGRVTRTVNIQARAAGSVDEATQLMRNIIDGGTNITIEARRNAMVSPAACSSDARGIVVSFNPDHDFSHDYRGKIGSGLDRIKGYFQSTPQAIPLGHELGHASRYAAGTHLPDMIPEETANMANENAFRRRLGLLLRKVY